MESHYANRSGQIYIFLTLTAVFIVASLVACEKLPSINGTSIQQISPSPSTPNSQPSTTPTVATAPTSSTPLQTPVATATPISDFRTLFPPVPAGLGEKYNHLVFFSNRSGVYLLYQVNVDGSNLVQLSENPDLNVYDMEPDWYRDGRIAFTSNHADDNWEIFVINPDQPAPIQLTNWGADSWSLRWSPDGKTLAFVSDKTVDDEIYLIPAAGGTPVNLTNSPSSNDYLPVWSPDGQKILFVSNREEGENFDIYVMNVDGSEVTRLTTAEGMDSSPSWSPDGSRIAFVSDREQNFEVYTMDYPNAAETKGGVPTRLTTTAEYEWSPTWSPDGKLIAFTSLRDKIDENYQLYVMANDGSDQTRLTNDPSNNIIPRWWP